jgi:hypothetical protein
MTETSTAPAAPAQQQRHWRREDRPDIKLPNGEILTPRIKFADDVKLSEDTLRKLNLPTVYLAGVAHVKKNASLMLIANGAKRRNEPPARRRKLK